MAIKYQEMSEVDEIVKLNIFCNIFVLYYFTVLSPDDFTSNLQFTQTCLSVKIKKYQNKDSSNFVTGFDVTSKVLINIHVGLCVLSLNWISTQETNG